MSDGKVEKLTQQTGERGRPRQVDVMGAGATTILGGRSEDTQIVGAPPRHGKTEILDRTSKTPEEPVDVRSHVEDVVASNEIRSAVPKPGDTQVRVRMAKPEDREEWKRVKEGKDD